MFKKIFPVILESVLTLSFYGALLSAVADFAFTLLAPNANADGVMSVARWFTIAAVVCLAARVVFDLRAPCDSTTGQRPAES